MGEHCPFLAQAGKIWAVSLVTEAVQSGRNGSQSPGLLLTPPLREVGGSCPRSQLSIFHCSVTGSCGSSDENCFGMIRPRGVSSSPDDTEKRNLEAASVYRASMQKRTR